MNIQGQRDLQLLSALEQDSYVTQRSLATHMGVALGLTNLYLKRLAHKGYIKATTIPSHRIKYLLTPRGLAEKSKLTFQHMQYSLSYYREMRKRLKRELSKVSQAGGKRFVVYGTSELAELTYLTLREMNLMVVGFVSDTHSGTFLSHPSWPVEALTQRTFDAVLISDLTDAKTILAQLIQAGVPKTKIVTPELKK